MANRRQVKTGAHQALYQYESRWVVAYGDEHIGVVRDRFNVTNDRPVQNPVDLRKPVVYKTDFPPLTTFCGAVGNADTMASPTYFKTTLQRSDDAPGTLISRL